MAGTAPRHGPKRPPMGLALCLTIVSIAVLAGGCRQSGGLFAGGPGGGTNAPVASFANMSSGSEEDFILNVGRRVHFAENSAELDATARTTLDKQAEWLRRYGNWYVKLQGFSDDPGSVSANKALAKKRADAVMNYLASQGVDRRRMWSRGYGRERLVRDCPEIECKSQNRRVISNLRDERET